MSMRNSFPSLLTAKLLAAQSVQQAAVGLQLQLLAADLFHQIPSQLSVHGKYKYINVRSLKYNKIPVVKLGLQHVNFY